MGGAMADREDLRELLEETRSAYGTYFNELDKDEKFYRGDYGTDLVPADWADESLKKNPTVPSTANDAVENASDHILTTPKIWIPSRPVVDKKELEDRIATGKRQFLNSWWHHVRIDGGQPLERGKKKLVKEGRMVLKKTIDWNLVPDSTNRRQYRSAVERLSRSKFLWKLKLCPNQTIFEDPDNPYDPGYVFEEYKIRIRDAKKMWPDKEGDWRKMRDQDQVTYTEYWSKPYGDNQGEFVAWVDKEIIHNDVNPYSFETSYGWDGYIPYVIGDSGWGDTDPDARPEDRYWGILRPMRSILVAEARQLTSVEAWLRFYIWKLIIARGIPEEQELVVGPGKVVNLTEEQTLEVLQLGDAPLAVFQFLSKVQQLANQSSKFGTLGGVAQTGVDTASEADMNTRNAATKLTGPVASLQRMITIINRWVLMDVEKIIEAPVTLTGNVRGAAGEITLLPSHIRGYYDSFVELGTTDQAALNDRAARLHNDLARINPFYSYRRALEMSGDPDPDESMINRLAEDALLGEQSRMYREIAHLKTLGELGERLAQAAETRAIVGETGAVAPSPGGDEQALTTVEGLGNPVAPAITRSRQDAVADQAVEEYR